MGIVQLVVGKSSPCDVGFVKVIKDYAPSCIDACSEVCTPLSQAAIVFMSSGDPVPQMCMSSAAFKCLVNQENKASCAKLLDYAQDNLGFAVPRTAELVDTTCAGCPDKCGVPPAPA